MVQVLWLSKILFLPRDGFLFHTAPFVPRFYLVSLLTRSRGFF